MEISNDGRNTEKPAREQNIETRRDRHLRRHRNIDKVIVFKVLKNVNINTATILNGFPCSKVAIIKHIVAQVQLKDFKKEEILILENQLEELVKKSTQEKIDVLTQEVFNVPKECFLVSVEASLVDLHVVLSQLNQKMVFENLDFYKKIKEHEKHTITQKLNFLRGLLVLADKRLFEQVQNVLMNCFDLRREEVAFRVPKHEQKKEKFEPKTKQVLLKKFQIVDDVAGKFLTQFRKIFKRPFAEVITDRAETYLIETKVQSTFNFQMFNAKGQDFLKPLLEIASVFEQQYRWYEENLGKIHAFKKKQNALFWENQTIKALDLTQKTLQNKTDKYLEEIHKLAVEISDRRSAIKDALENQDVRSLARQAKLKETATFEDVLEKVVNDTTKALKEKKETIELKLNEVSARSERTTRESIKETTLLKTTTPYLELEKKILEATKKNEEITEVIYKTYEELIRILQEKALTPKKVRNANDRHK